MGINRKTFSVLFALVLLSGLVFIEPAYAKTVTDPNHKGWTGKHPRSKQVAWKPISAKCKNCSQMVAQYNDTMTQLLQSRYWNNFWRQVNKNREKGKKDPFWPGKGELSEFEGQAVGANLELMELQSTQLELHRNRIRMLEQQASYLRAAIIECEATACGKAKKPKIKDIKLGGETVKQPFQPDIAAILQQHGVNWVGPYQTNCAPCVPIVAQLNAVPGWITRAHFKLQNAQGQLAYKKLIDKSNKIKLEFLKYAHPDKNDYSRLEKKVATLKSELVALKRVFDKLLKDLAACEKKYCASKIDDEAEKVSLGADPLISIGPPDVCTSPAANQAISIGPNSEVGSSANFREKAKKKAAGVATKAITSLLGIGGGGKSEGPATYKDPIKKKMKTRVRDKAAKRDFYSGGGFTPDGLLISSDIKKAPGKGTFHTIYLENARGWRLMPIALLMYEIWRDWKLSVSWTRDTYLDGELVKHEEGGWTESWRELIARGEEVVYGEVQMAPLWQQLGFNTAVSGARSLGTLFPITPEMLVSEPWNLVVHVSDPKKDPVVSVPYIFQLGLNDKGNLTTEQVENTVASERVDCDNTVSLAKTQGASTTDMQKPSVGEGVKDTVKESPGLTRRDKLIEIYGPDYQYLAPNEQYAPNHEDLDVELSDPDFDRVIRLENAVDAYLARADLDAKNATLEELKTLQAELLDNGLSIESAPVSEVSETITELTRQIANSEREIASRQERANLAFVGLVDGGGAAIEQLDKEFEAYKAAKEQRAKPKADDPLAVISVRHEASNTTGSHELSNRDARKILDKHKRWTSGGQRLLSVLNEIGTDAVLIGSTTKTLSLPESTGTAPSVSMTCSGDPDWQLGVFYQQGRYGLEFNSAESGGIPSLSDCAVKSTLQRASLLVTDYFAVDAFDTITLEDGAQRLSIKKNAGSSPAARNAFEADDEDDFADRDGDGIEDSIDTKPDEFSDEFIQKEGSMVGKIINRNGNTVRIIDYGGGGVGVEVGNETDNDSAIELLGVGLDVSPGTIMEASFG